MFLELLEDRRLLCGEPFFATPLANQILPIDGSGLTLGIDGDDPDGDPLTIVAVSDDPDFLYSLLSLVGFAGLALRVFAYRAVRRQPSSRAT